MLDPRRAPRRKLSDAELESLAQVSASDVERAAALWRKDAPPELRGLVDAEPMQPKDLP